MSEYYATVRWKRGESEAYTDNKYSRGHEWHFDGGTIVPASSSPHIVPLPYSIENNGLYGLSYAQQIAKCQHIKQRN